MPIYAPLFSKTVHLPRTTKAGLPSHIIMFWPNGQPNLTLGLDAGHQSGNEVLTGYSRPPFRSSKQSACDRASWMDDCVKMCVIIIVDM